MTFWQGALVHHLDGATGPWRGSRRGSGGSRRCKSVGVRWIGLAHSGRLLADAQVGGAGMGVGDAPGIRWWS